MSQKRNPFLRQSTKVPTTAGRFTWALFPPQLIEIGHKSIRPLRSEMKTFHTMRTDGRGVD